MRLDRSTTENLSISGSVATGLLSLTNLVVHYLPNIILLIPAILSFLTLCLKLYSDARLRRLREETRSLKQQVRLLEAELAKSPTIVTFSTEADRVSSDHP